MEVILLPRQGEGVALEGVGSEGRRSLNSQTYYNELGLDFLPGQGMTKGSQEGVFLTL